MPIYGDQTQMNPNQPVLNAGVSDSFLLPPPAHTMSPRTDATPKSPGSDVTLMAEAGERSAKRLREALEGAERTARRKVGELGVATALLIFGISTMSVGVYTICIGASLRRPGQEEITSILSVTSIATLILGVLTSATATYLFLHVVNSEH
ncbi:hypothetical protein LXA43DRAFT_542719 [Ganoderma leucocontextum]|nr:hypothetical protein LXA43DRAFT_542719 [Ganoderma leucocontextum]